MLQDVEHKAKSSRQLGNLFAKKTMAFLVMRNKSTQTCMVDADRSNVLKHFIPSSETQGQSVGSGEKAGRKFSSTGKRAPGYRLSPNYFQNSSGCRLLIGHKTALYYCAQSTNSFSWVLFVSHTRRLLSRAAIVPSLTLPHASELFWSWISISHIQVHEENEFCHCLLTSFTKREISFKLS